MVYVAVLNDNGLRIQAQGPAQPDALAAAEAVMNENSRRLHERANLDSSLCFHIIHDYQVVRHDGASGLRGEGLLQNVLQRPVNKWRYKGADIFECAAAYAFGIAGTHEFVDGKKRIAVNGKNHF